MLNFFKTEYKLLPLLFTFFGTFLALFAYLVKLNSFYNLKATANYKLFFNFFLKKWYFDKIYNEIVSQNVLKAGYQISYQAIDRGLLERVGPAGLIEVLAVMVSKLKAYQSGSIFSYLYYFLLLTLFFILVLF